MADHDHLVELSKDNSQQPTADDEHKSRPTWTTDRSTRRSSLQICAICADSSDGLHFGALACRACAAFFRRTIARRLKYICRFANDCEIGRNSRAICRSCRLARCYQSGMNPRAVSSEYHYQHRRHNPQKLPVVPSRSPSPLPRPIPLRRPSTTHSASPISPNNRPHLARSTEQPPKLRQIIDSYAATPPPPFVDSTLALGNKMVGGVLQNIMAGYERLQNRRDDGFGRVRKSIGVPSRIYLEKKEIEFRSFWERIRMEVDWLAELLTSFEGYHQMEIEDKMLFFKRYWITFLVMERCLDTLRILGSYPDDIRMVFPNGDILNLNTVHFDMRAILEHPNQGDYRPWFWRAQEMLPPLKKLRPDEVEMAFCLGIAFWKVSPDMASKVSNGAEAIAERAAKAMYAELSRHYAKMGPEGPNVVERVAEMMRLIAYTEKVVMARKEDAILAKTFKAFKIDIFLEDIFGPVETD